MIILTIPILIVTFPQLLPFLVIFGIIKFIRKNPKETHLYKSRLPITIYYTPPKNIDIGLASLIYGAPKDKILITLIYFRATKGYLSIEEIKKKGVFTSRISYILHKKTYPPSHRDEILLDDIFGSKSNFDLESFTHSKYENFLKDFNKEIAIDKIPYYTKKEEKILYLFKNTIEILNGA